VISFSVNYFVRTVAPLLYPTFFNRHSLQYYVHNITNLKIMFTFNFRIVRLVCYVNAFNLFTCYVRWRCVILFNFDFKIMMLNEKFNYTFQLFFTHFYVVATLCVVYLFNVFKQLISYIFAHTVYRCHLQRVIT
jgi:hypothetical protein